MPLRPGLLLLPGKAAAGFAFLGECETLLRFLGGSQRPGWLCCPAKLGDALPEGDLVLHAGLPGLLQAVAPETRASSSRAVVPTWVQPLRKEDHYASPQEKAPGCAWHHAPSTSRPAWMYHHSQLQVTSPALTIP